MTALWPHQQRAVSQALAAIARGERRILVASPTGGGKTRVMLELARHYLGRGEGVSLYTNRKLLVEQTSKVLAGAGLSHGVRASGHCDDRHRDMQVSSVQTEHARVTKSGAWELHRASLVLIDEAHLQKGAMVAELMRRHLESGAAVVGLTATPLDLSAMYDGLIVAGTTSELRECGALVFCHHYGPDEPDLRHIKKYQLGEDLSEKDNAKAIMVPGVFGRVLEWFGKLNPDRRPAILFAPGVGESLWFAQQFHKARITAAHIDGAEVWINGITYPTSRHRREEVLEGSRSGKINVICNRFVLREGVDAPWLAHGIFATVFGSLQSYLQSGGRLLRAHPGKTEVTVQDHGGCLDDATQVLTPRGWLGPDEIADHDSVAAFDRYSGSITWQPILHRHDRTLEPGEQMFEAKGRQCDIRVTGNHKIVFNKRTSTADNRPVWPDNFDLDRADALAGSKVRFKIPVSGVQKATGVPLTDDEIRFVGWFVTDGTMSGTRQAVSITQADHQPQIEDLRACLRGCGFDFRETKRKPSHFAGSRPQTQFHIPKGTDRSKPRKGWWPLRRYLDKDLSPNLELMDERQFAVFLYAVHLGDGDKARQEDSYRISTGNKLFADRLQSLCVRRGWKCNVSKDDSLSRLNPIYVLNVQKTATLILHGEAGAEGQCCLEESPSIPGLTRVWCVANPLQTLVTRRNGKVAIVGNSWWRHGSLNADREWRLEYTAHAVAALREQAYRDKAPGTPVEPFRCPQCAAILGRARCRCGWDATGSRKSRPVAQADGTMKEMRGDVFRPRRTSTKPDAQKIWEKVYHRCKRAGQTFRQAEALFAAENDWGWPSRELPLMPKEPLDFFRKIQDVPRENLQ